MEISIGSFTSLDWLVVAILLYSIVMSAVRGFVREIMGLVTVTVAFVLAAWLYRDIGMLFIDVVRTENLALFFGFSLVFGSVLIIGFTLIWVTYRFFEFARIEWVDRVLGGALGFIRGWLIGAVIFLGLTSFDVQEETVRRSELSPYFLPGSRVMALVTPFELKAKFLIGYNEVQRWWSEGL